MYLPAVNLRWPLMMGNMGQPQCGAGGGGGGHGHIPTSLHSHHTGSGLPGPSNGGGSGSTGLPSNSTPQPATTSTASAFKSVPSSSSCPNGVAERGSGGGAPCHRGDQAPTTPPHPAAPGLHSAPGPGAQHAAQQNAAVAAAAAAAAAATQLQGFCAPGGGGGIYSGGMDERTAAMMMGLKEAGGGGGGGSGGGGHYAPPVSAAGSPHLTHPAFPMSVPMWFNPTQTAYSLFLGGEKALAASQYLAATDPFAKANPFFDLARMGHYPLGKKLFGCPQCRYITDRKNNLKRHVATMHQECDKSLECCGVVFKNKASLRDHVLIFHSNGYMCRFCGRNFCRKALLKRHLTVHSGQKDYLCSQCDYATSHKSNLERHKKVHERQPTDSEDNDLDGSPSKDESPHCTSTTPSFSVASLFSPQHHPRISGSTSDSADAEQMSRGLSPTGSIVRTVHAHSTTSEHPLSERERPLVGGLGNNINLTLPRFGHHHSNHEDDLDLNVLKPPRPHVYAGDKLVHEDDLPLSPIDVEEDANTLIDVAN